MNTRQEDDAKTVVSKAVKSLSLRNSHFHCELKYDGDVFKVIEIAPRVGFQRDFLYHNTYNIDVRGNEFFVKFATEKIVKKSTIIGHAAVYKVFPMKEGVVHKIENLDAVRQLKSCNHLWSKIEIGDTYTYMRNGGTTAFVGIKLVHKDKDQFEKDCKFVEENFVIETK
jgi:hypothetical protein